MSFVTPMWEAMSSVDKRGSDMVPSYPFIVEPSELGLTNPTLKQAGFIGFGTAFGIPPPRMRGAFEAERRSWSLAAVTRRTRGRFCETRSPHSHALYSNLIQARSEAIAETACHQNHVFTCTRDESQCPKYLVTI